MYLTGTTIPVLILKLLPLHIYLHMLIDSLGESFLLLVLSFKLSSLQFFSFFPESLVLSLFSSSSTPLNDTSSF